jgi:hypothetical protein
MHSTGAIVTYFGRVSRNQLGATCGRAGFARPAATAAAPLLAVIISDHGQIGPKARCGTLLASPARRGQAALTASMAASPNTSGNAADSDVLQAAGVSADRILSFGFDDAPYGN